jgi:hypothetical protein
LGSRWQPVVKANASDMAKTVDVRSASGVLIVCSS